jgi:membrane fusion protein, multidrug efflux system
MPFPPSAKTALPLALAACLGLSGCGRAPAQTRQEAPRPVRVEAVTLERDAQVQVYSGSIQARRLADLAFRVGGKVIERPVDVGAHIRAGQVLARLDPADLQLSLEAAESALLAATADDREAHAEFARYDALGRNSPAYLPAEYDRRQAAMGMADARLAQVARQLALARDQLAYSTLVADADGVITALPVELGQVVTAGQTVATLAHSDETEVVVDVPENRLPEIRTQQVAVALWSLPDRPIKGRVREIGARADAASRTFAVKVTLLDPPAGALSLGMTATVRFSAPRHAPVIILPATALTDRDGKPAVWLLPPGGQHASLQLVNIASYRGDGTIAIASGLAPGQQIVTAGASLLDEHLPVVAWAGTAR